MSHVDQNPSPPCFYPERIPAFPYNAAGEITPFGKDTAVPVLPDAVRETCKRKGIALDNLRYDGLSNYWYPETPWHGMFLGIEPDGHSHS